MKKRTVITTETREVWVIHQSSSSIDPKTTGSTNEDSPEQSLTSTLDIFNDAANNALENPTTSEEQE